MQDLRDVTSESEFLAEPPDCKPVLGRMARVLLVVAGIGLLTGLAVWSSGAERRAIRNLPAAERGALYHRTLQNLQTVCAAGKTSMRDFCEEQARLAQAFPECDDACYAIAEKQVSRVQLPR